MAMGGVVSRKVPAPPNLPKEFVMKPRIYTYKVTFEETPDWYWGSHKEVKYGDGYLGSPKAHTWKWEFYTPHLQICEVFPYTDEGWTEAQNAENRCIRPDLNNPLCLNEHCGSVISLEACRRGAQKTHEVIHAEKDNFGRSLHAVKTLGRVHDEKDGLGRSIQGVKNAERMNKILHQEKDDLGRSIHGVKSAKRMHEEKDDLGRSVNSVKGMTKTNSQKWEDPDHPEIGEHNPGNLVRIQKRRGYPHGPENRRKFTAPSGGV
jgi:hypothetical protein